MAGTIQGVGLLRANAALAALAEDPERLDQERGRFSESPPSYRSNLSPNSTLSQPTPCDEEQDRLNHQKWQLIREQDASFPRSQFDAQASEEYNRLSKPRTSSCVFDDRIEEIAEETIRKRWVEQGIWNDKWGSLPSGRWKHEEPQEPEFDPEADVELPRFSFSAKRAGAEPRRPKTDEEIRQIAERRAAQARERDASRPFHQFIYQLSIERRRLQDEITLGEPAAPDLSGPNLPAGSSVYQPQNESNGEGAVVPTPPDINTTAYEIVKNTWMKRGIWNRKWGVMPGMSWKHEQYIKDLCREEMGDDFARLPADAFNNFLRPDEQVSAERPAKFDQPHSSSSAPLPPARIPSPPVRVPSMWNNISGAPLSAESSHTHGTNASPQEQHLATVPAGLPNDNADHAIPVSNSQDNHTANGEEHQLPPRQSRQRGNRTLAANKQGSQIAAAALGPSRLSGVSKKRGKATSVPRQRRKSLVSLSEVQQSSHVPDASVPSLEASPVLRRRSERLQKAKPKLAGDASSTTTTGSGVGNFRARPKRTHLDLKPAGSAKPEGLSKSQPKKRRKAK